VQSGDQTTLNRILHETEMFTEEEIGIALELIDIALHKPDQQDYLIYVIEDNGEVLGYYCIGPTPATSGTYDLYWIAVRPSAQGTGMGGALTRHAEDLVRSRKGTLVIAETSSQPRYGPTRKFYLSHGYDQLARIRDYYRVGDDLVVFGKYLT
jgi:ribosomal protein S18 acetylase RimI-like enzyme